ncbi:hypothetical protein TrVE_jg9837 [Triparma verrucosa]|uniref:Uncharacterized protein n=1 Tax=Triparma verrucosa TaxID=1606542 RepID=A0A9W7F481_9STRA|nr:hypothetical protein TrVE_jg9837 [Triparma verrucosa]
MDETWEILDLDIAPKGANELSKERPPPAPSDKAAPPPSTSASLPRLQTLSDSSLEDVKLVGDVEVEPDLEDEDEEEEEFSEEYLEEESSSFSDSDQSDIVMISKSKLQQPKPAAPKASTSRSLSHKFAFLFLLLPILYSIIYERTLAISCASYTTHGNASSPLCQTHVEASQPLYKMNDADETQADLEENVLLMLSPPPKILPNHYQLTHLPRSAPKLLTTLRTFLNLYIRAFSTSLEVLLTLTLPPHVLDELRGTFKAVHIRANEVIVEIKDSEAYERSIQAFETVSSQTLLLASDAYNAGSKTYVQIVNDPKFLEYRDLAFTVSKELVTVGSRALATIQQSEIADSTYKVGRDIFNDVVVPVGLGVTEVAVNTTKKFVTEMNYAKSKEVAVQFAKQLAVVSMDVGKTATAEVNTQLNDFVKKLQDFDTETAKSAGKTVTAGATKVTRELVNDIFIPAGTYFGKVIVNATSKKN